MDEDVWCCQFGPTLSCGPIGAETIAAPEGHLSCRTRGHGLRPSRRAIVFSGTSLRFSHLTQSRRGDAESYPSKKEMIPYAGIDLGYACAAGDARALPSFIQRMSAGDDPTSEKVRTSSKRTGGCHKINVARRSQHDEANVRRNRFQTVRSCQSGPCRDAGDHCRLAPNQLFWLKTSPPETRS